MSRQNLDNFEIFTGDIDYVDEDPDGFEAFDLISQHSAEMLRTRLHADGEYIGNSIVSSHALRHTASYINNVEVLDIVVNKTSCPSEETYHTHAPTDSLYTVFPNEQIQWSQALEVMGMATSNLEESKQNRERLRGFLEHYHHGEKTALSLRELTVECGKNNTSHGYISLDGYIHPVLSDQCCTVVLIRDETDRHLGFGVQSVYPGISRENGEEKKPSEIAKYMEVYNKDMTAMVRQTEAYKHASTVEKMRLATSVRTDLLSDKEKLDPASLSHSPRLILDRECSSKGSKERFGVHYFLEDGSEYRCFVSEAGISVNLYRQNRLQPVYFDEETGRSVDYISITRRDANTERFAKDVPELYTYLCEVDRIITIERQYEIQMQHEKTSPPSFEDLFFAGHEDQRVLIEKYEQEKNIEKTKEEPNNKDYDFSP